ncbi:MAG TPA: tetraacyldisaccharide 4'-kinase [Planctomycetaceae bacterium]|nr:tetraacyldisaccharide 4'-kinase [Planctomycetaceae bacterium]
MDETRLLEILSGERRGLSAALSRWLLAGLSAPYGAAVSARNLAYDRGWLMSRRAAVPVISVGNLTTGGTGKTPFTAFLARELQSRGLRPGLLSRGYRSLDGAENDEKRVLDRLCPGVPQVQNPDRVAGAERAIREFGCEVLILDDGLQHRRLQRDVEIVLIDALRPWGFGRLLPRGLLREPMSGLRRADLIVITRADQASAARVAELRRKLAEIAPVPVAEVAFEPGRLIDGEGAESPLSSLEGRVCLAFCGIGNPEGFAATLRSAGISAELEVFPDHHHYTAADFERLRRKAEAIGAAALVTTLKDLVKLPGDSLDGPSVLAVDQRVRVLHGANEIARLMDRFGSDRARAA